MSKIKSNYNINRDYFKRRHNREQVSGSYFPGMEAGVSWLSKVAIAVFFTPIVLTTSLFSHTTLIILTHITLAVGYLSNFIYRAAMREMSLTEFTLTLLGLSASIGLAVYLTPAYFASFTSLGASVTAANILALAVNGCFLIKNVALPPFKNLIEMGAQLVGLRIKMNFFYRKPLSLEREDEEVVDLLMKKHHKPRPGEPHFSEAQLRPFNNLLTLLMRYINKYNARFFGDILYQSRIQSLESMLDKITTKGNTETSVSFVELKISFKSTKVKRLTQAKNALSAAKNKNDPAEYRRHALHFFTDCAPIRTCAEMHDSHLKNKRCLQSEIKRQKKKITNLQACYPTPKPL